MSDHKASAQDWLGMADEHGDWILDRPKKTVERYLAAAQVEATLYLAEQQRIANLIALSQATDGNGWQAEAPLDAIYEYETVDYTGGTGDNGLRVRAAIREGLGLL